MEMVEAEKRRFILWSIARAVPTPRRGDNSIQPIDQVANPASPSKVSIAVRKLAHILWFALFANPLKTFAWTSSITLSLAIALAGTSTALRWRAEARQANAYAEIDIFGGSPTYFPSRIVFYNPALRSQDLPSLAPYLRIVAERSVEQPERVILDFTRTPNITESEAKQLLTEVDAMVYYRSSSGRYGYATASDCN